MKVAIGLAAIGVFILLMIPALAVDITVDGNIDDWGLSNLKSGDWSQAATWIPTKDGISFFVEDNQDPLNTGAINYNASYTGVHIYGNKTVQKIYREPLLAGNRVEPYGGQNGKYGEEYDIEGMYVTDNDSYIFVLIIFSTGMLGDTPYALADLALNFDLTGYGGYGYELGVNLHRVHNTDGELGGIYLTPNNDDWSIPSPFAQNRPAEILDFSNKVGNAIIAYGNLGVTDHGRDNHVLEIAIPKSAVGNVDVPDHDPDTALKMFRITELCGNDTGPSIPEFLSILIPIGIIVGTTYYFRKSRSR